MYYRVHYFQKRSNISLSPDDDAGAEEGAVRDAEGAEDARRVGSVSLPALAASYCATVPANAKPETPAITATHIIIFFFIFIPPLLRGALCLVAQGADVVEKIQTPENFFGG